MSNFSCSPTRNITLHSMENLAFHSSLRWEMIIWPILATSLIHCLSKMLGECRSETVKTQQSFVFQVVTNLLGAMREFAYNKRNILILYEERVIAILVKLLNLTDSCVLINSTRLLAVCATEPYSRGSAVTHISKFFSWVDFVLRVCFFRCSVIFTSDGLRLLWSLFKSRDPKVRGEMRSV